MPIIYPVQNTVTASERARWRAIMADLLLANEPPIIDDPVPAGALRIAHLVDPHTEREIVRFALPTPDHEDPLGSQQAIYQSFTSTSVWFMPASTDDAKTGPIYEPLFPDDPECLWYFWVGGDRWWEPFFASK